MSGYESSQEKLRDKHGYEKEDEETLEDIVLEEAETNPQVYRDIEPLLFRGFLCQSARVGVVSFVFKSLNHHEYEMAQILSRSGSGSKKDVLEHYCRLMAYGVWMVEGTLPYL